MIVETPTNLIDQELEAMFELEKRARQDNDMDLSVKTCLGIVELLWKSGDLEKTMSTTKILTTKRGQLIKSITEVVRLCMGYIQQIADIEMRMKFVDNLKEITEKKIYLEVEYARCCMILVKHNEHKSDKLQDAADIMENVQVETYGSMSKKEKMEFILYQMKLNLLLDNFVKLYIVSKKVNVKTLNNEGFEYEKISYYLYSYYFFQNKGDYKECVNCLKNAYDALKAVDFVVEEGPVDKILLERFSGLLNKDVLTQSLLSFKCLEEFNDKKQEEIEELVREFEVYVLYDKSLSSLLKAFTSKEVSSCSLPRYNLNGLTIFTNQYLNSDKFRVALEVQLVKKNLFMVSRYYRTIRMNKLTVLFENKADFIEDQLCKMIQDGLVKAKIDRLDMLIKFVSCVDEKETIDKWVDNINGILDLVNFVTERIEREEVKA